MEREQAAGDHDSENPTIVLHRPQSSENIGSAARAMWNMGLSHLIVIDPVRWDSSAARRLATAKAAHVIDGMQVCGTLEEALEAFQFVIGTTARTGGLRQTLWTPAQAARGISDLLPQNRVAVVFGPEDRGLTNHDLRLCQALVRIPTAEFASLNLAQAVMIVCYEIHLAGMTPAQTPAPVLASSAELEQMYSRLQETLTNICLIHPNHADYGMMKVRQFLSRLRLRRAEVRLLRGLCRQIEWYAQHRAAEAFDNAKELH
jgi:tRNA/rRNA methyltransferase